MTLLKSDVEREGTRDCQYLTEERHEADLELRLSPMCGLVSSGMKCRTIDSKPDRDSSSTESGYKFYFWDGSRWMNFSSYSNTLLGTALENGKLEMVVVPGGNNSLYEVDFRHKIQKNTRTGYVRSIGWECLSTGLRVGFDAPSERLELLHGGVDRMVADREDVDMSVETVATEKATRNFQSKATDFFSKLGHNVRALESGSTEFCAVKLLLEKGLSSQNSGNKDHGGPNCRASLTAIQKVVNSTAKSTYFGEQVLEMERSRGDANLRYAWHGGSAEEIAAIVIYGFGQKTMAVGDGNRGHYGYGTYLAPQSKVEFARRNAPEDGNKERHMLLCEVILGECEIIPPGSSHRFLPSSASYDSGTDDMENPNLYVIWSPFINSHIIPWYIVSFTMSTMDEQVVCAPQQQRSNRPPKSMLRKLNSTRTAPYPPLRVPIRDPSVVQKLFQPSSISPSLSPASQAAWLSILASPVVPSPTTPTTALQVGVNSLSLASPATPPSSAIVQNFQKGPNCFLLLASPTSVLHHGVQQGDHATTPALLSLGSDTSPDLSPLLHQQQHRNAAEVPTLHLSLTSPGPVDLSLPPQQHRDPSSHAAAAPAAPIAAATSSKSTEEVPPKAATSITTKRATTFCRLGDGTIQLGDDIYIPSKSSSSSNSTGSHLNLSLT